MANKTAENYGTICWVDLETPNVKTSKAFYSEILGWNFKELDGPHGQTYTVGQVGDRGVCGMMSGKLPHWNMYVWVKSVDEHTQKAKKLGAIVLQEPMDVGNMGRMSTLQDPTGAKFSLWQLSPSAKTEGHEPFMQNTPGSFCWAELATNDTKKAENFYSALFGWTPNQQAPKENYTVFKQGDTMIAGMLPIEKNWDAVEPQWFIYFSVDDCDKRAEQAKSMKATIGVPPQDIPTVGRFCMLKDPQGAHVAFIKLLPSTQSAGKNKK